MQARPVPINFGRCDAGLRQSQQVRQIAGKHPKTGFLMRLENAFYNFKESPIPIIDRKHDSANLISQRKHDCQPASANANPSRLDPVTQRHTPHDATLYNATRYTLADPVHYIQRHTLTGSQHGTGI